MDKKQMREVALDVLERYPNVDKVYVTSDEQAFTSENFAKMHAKNNRTGKELAVEVFYRQEAVETDDTKPEAKENKPEAEENKAEAEENKAEAEENKAEAEETKEANKAKKPAASKK